MNPANEQCCLDKCHYLVLVIMRLFVMTHVDKSVDKSLIYELAIRYKVPVNSDRQKAGPPNILILFIVILWWQKFTLTYYGFNGLKTIHSCFCQFQIIASVVCGKSRLGQPMGGRLIYRGRYITQQINI